MISFRNDYLFATCGVLVTLVNQKNTKILRDLDLICIYSTEV